MNVQAGFVGDCRPTSLVYIIVTMIEDPPTTIEVDAQAAEILRRASARARANGETLGTYLMHVLPAEETTKYSPELSKTAWDTFVKGMTTWVSANVPAGHIADDSRESIYDDRL